MSENKHKCKLTGVELQREFLEIIKFNWKISPKNPDEIMVDISEGELPPFYVTFSEFAKYGNIYWIALKEFPITILPDNDGTERVFDVVINYNTMLSKSYWFNVKPEQLEETILQAVVTHHNINKHKEEQT